MISIIIPVYNEEASVKPLQEKLNAVLGRINQPYEIIYVDDGSTDNTFSVLAELKKLNANTVKVIQFTRNFEKSAALMAGFKEAVGEVVITMDGDLQDEPEEIPRFLAKINEGYDCVTGWKANRRDPLSKIFPSKIFNFLVSRMVNLRIHDYNCGFKAYSQEAVAELNLYGGLYRFIPALLFAKGFRIAEIGVKHHPRPFGKSKYGAGRLVKGFLDITSLWALLRFSQQPSHFFGNAGLFSFLLGFLIIAGLYIAKFTQGILINQHPYLFLVGIALFIVGGQLFSTGILAEFLLGQRPKGQVFFRIKQILK